MSRAVRTAGLLGLAVLAASPAVSQDAASEGLCDTLRPVTNALGYRLRESSVRCEGLYESAVRAIGIELVGVMAQASFEASGSVEIVGPDPADLPPQLAGPIRVRAVALPLKAYYRMDGVLDEASRLAWPIDEVVLPAGLDPGDIGLYGWVGTEMDKTFIPVSIRTGRPEEAESEEIQLLLRVSSDAESVYWRTTENDAESEWQRAADGLVRSGQTIAIRLPPGPPSTVRVDVTAKPANSDEWTSLRFDVLRATP